MLYLPALLKKSLTLRRLAIAAWVLFAYALIGVAVAPWLARKQLLAYVQDSLGHHALIGDIRANPFTFEVEAKDLALDDAGGARLAAFSRLYVNFEPTGVFRRAWRFSTIRLEDPTLNVERREGGRLNWADLIDRLPKSEDADPNDPPPRVLVDRLEITGGAMDLADRALAQPFLTRIAPLEFQLDELSTLPEDKGPYALSAMLPEGGKLRWKGEIGLNPVRASGDIVLEGYTLHRISSYLRQTLDIAPLEGSLGASASYRFSLMDGRPQLQVLGARAHLRDFSLTPSSGAAPLLQVSSLDLADAQFDLAEQAVSIDGLKLGPTSATGEVDAHGRLNWLDLMRQPGPDAADSKPLSNPAASPSAQGAGSPPAMTGASIGQEKPWRITVRSAEIEGIDAKVRLAQGATPAEVSLEGLSARAAAQADIGGALGAKVIGLTAELKGLRLRPDGASEDWLSLGQAKLEEGSTDLAGRTARAKALTVSGTRAKLTLTDKGTLDWAALAMPAGAAPAASPPPSARADGGAWQAAVDALLVEDAAVTVVDRGTPNGATVALERIRVALEGLSQDLNKPVPLSASAQVASGGTLELKGRVVPGTPEADIRLKTRDLALGPLQPYLARAVTLKLASGAVSSDLHFIYKAARKDGDLRMTGQASVSRLLLEEASGERFLAWDSLDARELALRLNPNLLDIGDLRLGGLDGKLIIKPDRSLNIADILVPSGSGTPQSPTARASESEASKAFPVAVKRMRLENGQLAFADLSLQPQFATRIHELGGSIVGLASDPDARAQVELDGRVDDYGQARARGTINPLAAKKHTDLGVLFRNVEMTKLTPYSGRFAGHKIQSGKMSLDLKYRIENSQLAGENQIILDQLTLGEHVDSPDAVKLPLELALALLKDGNGRIDIGLPVKGSLDDPEFSYGHLVWKAFSNFIVGIVAAPFRLLGRLLPGGENIDSVDFDPGQAVLLPPEREKLPKLVDILGKRPGLAISVQGRFDPKADADDIKSQRLRRELARRQNIAVKDDERLPAPALTDTRVQAALEALFEERYSAAELRALRSQGARPVDKPPGKVQEDKPAPPASLHAVLQARLLEKWPVEQAALDQLAKRRAETVLAALKDAKADSGRVSIGPIEPGEARNSGLVPTGFGIASK